MTYRQLRFVRHPSASSFLDKAQRFLVSAEAENVLLLGIAGEAVHSDHGKVAAKESAAPDLFTVQSGSVVVMAALHSPPRRLIVSRGVEKAVDTLVNGLITERITLPGVTGPVETARAFGHEWVKRTGQIVRPGRSLRVHQLASVNRVSNPPGVFRRAGQSDTPLLARWVDAFIMETGVDDPRSRRSIVEAAVDAERLYVWDDSSPVSMAMWSGATPSGVRITGVYTPGELRGRGYASACVASLSKLLLDRGYAFCALFTDLANPTSNRLYRRIGYQPVSDFIEYKFVLSERPEASPVK